MKDSLKIDPVLLWSYVATLIIAVRLVLRLWLHPRHRGASVLKRAVWSCIALIPFVGPIIYGGFYRVPAVQKPGERAPVNTAAFYGGGGGV